jgi:hypothetical protein
MERGKKKPPGSLAVPLDSFASVQARSISTAQGRQEPKVKIECGAHKDEHSMNGGRSLRR